MTPPETPSTRLFEVAGDDLARGRAQGQRFHARLAAMIDALASLPLGLERLPAPLRPAVVRLGASLLGRLYLPVHRPLLERHAEGRYGRVLQGLAAGFHQSSAFLYGLHAFEIESGIVGFQLGCTALAVPTTRAERGTPWLAYNHDFPSAFGPHLVIRRSVPTAPGVARTLCLTYEMMLGAIAGVNEHGLAATLNQAFARRPRRARAAFLPSTLVQDCLDHCHNVSEALLRLRDLPVNVGSLLTLVDAAGERAVVELAPGGHGLRRAGGPHQLLYAFNRYLHPRAIAQEIPLGAQGTGLASGYDLHRASVAREERLLALLAAGGAEPWTEERLHAVLSDHEDGPPGPTTLCRHDPGLGGDTIASALLDPRARTLRVCWGWPCQGQYGDAILLG